MLRPVPGQPGLFQLGDVVENDVKAQGVRVVDVIVIGPMMIAGGNAWAQTRPWAGLGLSLLGVMTMIYNASNYVRVRKTQP